MTLQRTQELLCRRLRNRHGQARVPRRRVQPPADDSNQAGRFLSQGGGLAPCVAGEGARTPQSPNRFHQAKAFIKASVLAKDEEERVFVDLDRSRGPVLFAQVPSGEASGPVACAVGLAGGGRGSWMCGAVCSQATPPTTTRANKNEAVGAPLPASSSCLQRADVPTSHQPPAICLCVSVCVCLCVCLCISHSHTHTHSISPVVGHPTCLLHFFLLHKWSRFGWRWTAWLPTYVLHPALAAWRLLSLSLSHTHTHSHTHTLSLSLTRTRTHAHTHTHTHIRGAHARTFHFFLKT
jgi:hypothetical protein